MADRNAANRFPVPVLYYAKGTRAMRPRWLLEELGAPYVLERIDLSAGKQKREPYLTVNPAGKVPALTYGSVLLTESLAICLFLADRFPKKNLAPAFDADERANYYKWMAYSIGTLEPAILEEARNQKRLQMGEPPFPSSPAFTPFETACSVVETVLEKHPYILGKTFSVADVMLGSAMNWATSINTLGPNKYISQWLANLNARPAYLRATTD